MSTQIREVWQYGNMRVYTVTPINRYSRITFLLNNGLCIMTNHLLRMLRSPSTSNAQPWIRYNSTHQRTCCRSCTSNINSRCECFLCVYTRNYTHIRTTRAAQRESKRETDSYGYGSGIHTRTHMKTMLGRCERA